MTSLPFNLVQDANPGDVLESLESYGVARLPGFLDLEDVQTLDAEFDALFASELAARAAVRYYRPNTDSRALELRRAQLDPNRFPTLARLFAADLVSDVTHDYLGDAADVINGIYLTHDLPHPTPVTGLHFDRIHALKFYVYLRATVAANGAFACIPGSHREGRARRLAHLSNGVRVRDIPIIQPDERLAESVSLEGGPGTMLIFDTDVLHAGGVVGAGSERRIVRGHSHAADVAR
ncbi:MAG: phytanoyl-CoA dioxygenase family protein [Coriobacteriia bacterium]|nr:phytanoyl-CoA dioxygenase family protein [Pseudomonadota bacterium]MDZ4178350.1 phytanoyl-CoA dioxygenase family protein [Coriobacteriia bacterium]